MQSLFRPSARLLTTLVLVLACSSVVKAQTPIGSDRPVATSIFTVGTMRVEAYGSGSPALVFVPGLACGSWVWDDAIRLYEKPHAVYVVTLAGFDGLPAPSGAPIERADASLLELITTRKLDRPILIGHSLGGFLVLRFGTERGDLIRGIVAVDGTPVFPALAQATPEARAAAGKRIYDQLSGLTAEQFATGEQSVIQAMVSEPANATRVAELAAKSDPAATAAYARDLYAADIRPQLANLTDPVLEIAPVPLKPAPFEGPNAANATPAARAAGYKDFYQSLFPGAPNVRVVPVENSRHFVMIDQPRAFYDAVSGFIATLAS